MLQCTGEVQSIRPKNHLLLRNDCGRPVLVLDSQYQIVSCERWMEIHKSELSSYLIISTMMMITGSRMISPTSTTATAAIVMDPPPDTNTVLR